MGSRATPTLEIHTGFDYAYEHFNRGLFEGTLPNCVITLQRKRRAYGYFANKSWVDATDEIVTDEIALNPDHFKTRPLNKVLSTLVHEMVHLQQAHFGKPGKNGYHNKQFASLMDRIGLTTVGRDKKSIGRRISHVIVPAGPFDQVCTELIESGFSLSWLTNNQTDNLENPDDPAASRKRASKTKFTCPQCPQNAWAKHDSRLMCGYCEVVMTRC